MIRGGFVEETGEFISLPSDGNFQLESQEDKNVNDPWSTSNLIGYGLGAVVLAFGIGATIAFVKKKKAKKGLNGSDDKKVKTKI